MEDIIDGFLEETYDKLRSLVRGYVSQKYEADTDTYKLYIARKDITYRFQLDNFSKRISDNNLSSDLLCRMVESNYKRVIINKIFFKKGERDNVTTDQNESIIKTAW